jgi:hypothetical protein
VNWATPPAGAYQPLTQVKASAPQGRISPAAIVLAILLIAAVAGGVYMVAGNGSKGSTAAGSTPTATAAAKTTGGPTSQPGTTAQPGASAQAGSGLSGASAAFSNINSFKFSMTLAGGTFGSMLSSLGGSSGSDQTFTMSGTITLKPEKAADIDMAGFRIIEVGGYDYIDIGGAGSYYKTPVSSGSGLADSLSPETMFSGTVGTSTVTGWNKVGTESKNGVQADHYQASASALSGFSSYAGVTDATWGADVWIAADGGYPVSMAVVGTASDSSLAYEILFDISGVNDAANQITAPTNVVGI